MTEMTMPGFAGLIRLQGALLVYGLLITLLVITGAEETRQEVPSSQSDDHHEADKRYLAALAKNGRLPKHSSATKKRQPLDSGEQNPSSGTLGSSIQDELAGDVPDYWLDDKRHIGAFLKSHGRPQFMRHGGEHSRHDRSAPFSLEDESLYGGDGSSSHLINDDVSSSSTWQNAVKRNIATLARLGRLNAIRYGRSEPDYTSGIKRVNFDEALNDAASDDSDDSTDCEDDAENETIDDADPGNDENNFVQEKRYIAALARSGRLPVWHTQRKWWGDKRDNPSAYWLRYRSGARASGGKRQTIDGNTRFAKVKSKRCKKSTESAFHGQEEKRNLQMLARKGALPYRQYVSA